MSDERVQLVGTIKCDRHDAVSFGDVDEVVQKSFAFLVSSFKFQVSRLGLEFRFLAWLLTRNQKLGTRNARRETLKSKLPSLEDRLAFVYVGVDPFFRVTRLKELLLQLTLEGESRFQRYLGPGLYATFDQTNSVRRATWRCELACVAQHLLQKALGRGRFVNGIDNAKLQTTFKWEKFRSRHYFYCFGFSY